MNKLDSNPFSPSFGIAPATCSYSGSAPRLIVLFPASEPETHELEQRIWEIARSLQLDVLLLSLTNDFDEEAQLRRKLIIMAAMIKDPAVSTDILIEHGNDWVRQVRKLWRKGDIVACYANQKVGIMRKALDQILRSSLNMPVYILADAQSVNSSKPTLFLQALFWLGVFAIIGGFFWVEARLVLLPQDWAHTALLYACVIVEFALIYLWNSLFT